MALYDYRAADGTQISLRAGEALVLVRKISADWWRVKSADGRDGLAPANYVGSPTAASLVHQPYFRGRISRTVAEQKLMSAPAGSFLVRENPTKAGTYTLSLRTRTGAVQHMKIIAQGADGFVLFGAGLALYPTVPDLIEHFQQVHRGGGDECEEVVDGRVSTP